MATIQINLEPELLQATDRAAKNGKLNRSALIRQALHAHLKKLRIQELEERERRAYEAMPHTPHEYGPWEGIALWPKDSATSHRQAKYR